MNRAQHQLMQIVQKIPVFDGLSLEQAEKIMKASQFKKFAAGETIYDIGKASDEMVILIKGTLSVVSATGQVLSEVGAGNSTGEMGVFTGYKRSANVVAKEDCAGLTVSRALMLQVMDGDRDVKSIILENVVRELSHRLGDANLRLDTLSRAQEEAATSQAQEEAVTSQAQEEAVTSQAQEEAATSQAKEIVASKDVEASAGESDPVDDIVNYYKEGASETEGGEEVADDKMPAAEDNA